MTYTGVQDRPTPSTDQLFQVRVVGVADGPTYKETTNPARESFKYYVPPNGIVVGLRNKTTATTSGPRSRSVHNPVYQCTAHANPDAMMQQLLDNNVRVFGIAYDGVSVLNMHNAAKHPDAVGRFSVIFAGAATVSAPASHESHEHLAYAKPARPAQIGDAVFANLFEDDQNYNFRGDPDEFRPWPVGYVPRDMWQRWCTDPLGSTGAYGVFDKTLAAQVFIAAFGQAVFDKIQRRMSGRAIGDMIITLGNIIWQCLVGFVLNHEGHHRNEVRLQLSLNTIHTLAYRIGSRRATVTTGFVDTADTTTTGDAFVDTVVECMSTEPDATPSDGCPEASLLGVVGLAAAGPTGTVGNLDYEHLSAADAGAIMAVAPRHQVGLGTNGKAIPGSMAAELLCAGPVDPNSAEKLATRKAVLQAYNAGTMPPTVGEHSSDDLLVEVNASSDAVMSQCPPAVVKSHNWVSASGTAQAPNPAFVHPVTRAGKPVVRGEEGQRLNVYGDRNADKFSKSLATAMKKVKEMKKSPHKLSPEKLTRIVDAANNALGGR